MIPKNEFKTRLSKIRALMKVKQLGAILFYAQPYEDFEYLRWLLGKQSLHTKALLITKNKEILFEARWRVDEAKENIIVKDVVPFSDRSDLPELVNKQIRNVKTLGIVGLLPFQDVRKLKTKIVDLNSQIEEIMEIKSDYEIKQIKKACEVAENALPVRIKPSVTEKQIANSIISGILSQGFRPVIDTSVISGERLKITDFGSPSNKRIKSGDIVAIDFGACVNGYNSDITRCFVVGKNKKFDYYVLLCKAHENVIKKIKPGIKSSKILELYLEELDRYGLSKSLVQFDLGHGIGCGNHEPPDIGESEDILKENMVFTLEPSINVDGIFLRIEDVVLLQKNGLIKLS